MKINLLTIFPEIYENFLTTGVVGKANGKFFDVNIIDIREYSHDKHKKVDDYVYGDKQGMLMTCQPFFSAIEENNLENTYTIFTSPKGKSLTQKKLYELSSIDEITILTARYEGLDQRIIDTFVDEEISIGDYIITGGELASQVIIDGIVRLIPGVINSMHSHYDDSFSNSLLEHKQYTRPQIYRDLKVPVVLIGGNHQKINEWIELEQLRETYMKRPDIIIEKNLSKKQVELLIELKGENEIS